MMCCWATGNQPQHRACHRRSECRAWAFPNAGDTVGVRYTWLLLLLLLPPLAAQQTLLHVCCCCCCCAKHPLLVSERVVLSQSVAAVCVSAASPSNALRAASTAGSRAAASLSTSTVWRTSAVCLRLFSFWVLVRLGRPQGLFHKRPPVD